MSVFRVYIYYMALKYVVFPLYALKIADGWEPPPDSSVQSEVFNKHSLLFDLKIGGSRMKRQKQKQPVCTGNEPCL